MRTALLALLPLLAACGSDPPPPAGADAGPWTAPPREAALSGDAPAPSRGAPALSGDAPAPSRGAPALSGDAPALSGDAPAPSRDGLAPPGERTARLGEAAPMTIRSTDPAALAEILTAAQRADAARPDHAGATKIGTSTGVPALPARPSPPEPQVEAAPRPRVAVGEPAVQGNMSTPAIEKAARAQLYWDLVQRCRGPDGKLLPPDVIRVDFNVDPEGYIVVPTVVATASDPRYDEAAACMRRELSAATFRVPAGARGLPTRVEATVPSVD